MGGTNLPTFTVWSDNVSLDELSIQGVPESVLRIGSRWFGAPSLPYWILDTILAYLRSSTRGILDTEKVPLLGVDVVLKPDYAQSLVNFFNHSGQKDLLLNLNLATWLTQQVNAYLRRYAHQGWRSNADWCVRCLTQDYPDGSAILPAGWNSLINQFSRKIISRSDEPPFQIYFPTRKKFIKEDVYILKPDSQYHLDSKQRQSLTTRLQPAHQQIIPNRHEEDLPFKQFPLVGSAEAIVVQFPLGYEPKENSLLYLRHAGRHETWVAASPEEHQWKIVPRDAWVPVPDGGKILLGRRSIRKQVKIQTQQTANSTQTNTHIEFPGSLILTCKKIQGRQPIK